MKEKDIENYLRTQVKKLGGIAYKFISPGNVGVPDRIIIMPNGKIYFVELKTDKGKLTELQNRQIDKIKNLGQEVVVVYGKSGADEFIKELLDGGKGGGAK